MIPYLKKALVNLISKPSTESFPNPQAEGLGNYRGRISFNPETCKDCGLCIKVCSPGAITREEEDAEGGVNVRRTFDLTSCTFCGMCQDFCDEGSIKLTKDFHMVARNAEDLKTTGVTFKEKVLGKLVCDRENCIYCGLCMRNCPQGAITVVRADKKWEIDYDKCVQCGICIGKCPKKVLKFEEPKEEGVVFDAEKCVYCTLCAKKCPVGAIEVDRKEKSWKIDRSACIKCGACVSACPKKALEMGPVE